MSAERLSKPQHQNIIPLYGVLIFFLILNIGFWFNTRNMHPIWGNVPPAPGKVAGAGMGLGDHQLAYRITGMMLQNLGNMNGKTHNLKEYNYDHLGDWLMFADTMDPVSNFIPTLAAYYFGGVSPPKDLMPLINYLVKVGHYPQEQKWRWLAQAAYLARYSQNDINLSLELANQLASLPRDDLPLWAKQMPIIIMNAKGDKNAAYAILMGTLTSGLDTLSPTEIAFMRNYICEEILTPIEAASNVICNPNPQIVRIIMA